ncbi:MAG: adenylate cyclase [Gammaproteobacteria bacterium]|jgi:adenylate cyclase
MVAIVLVAVLTTMAFQALHVFTRLESASFDHRVSFTRSSATIHDDVVIVLIDDSSLQKMSGQLGRFPWPRSAYREIIDFFALAGAQTLAFDILFTEQQDAGKSNENDNVLIEATRRAGNVVHAMQVLYTPALQTSKTLPADFLSIQPFEATKMEGEVYNDFLLPIDGLYQVSRGVGFLEISPDRDGVYRRVRLFNQFHDGTILPSLASTIATPLVAGGGAISYSADLADLNGFEIPLDGKGNHLINPYGNIQKYSISQVFEAMAEIKSGQQTNLTLDPKIFEGKIVLLGASAIGLLDVKATSLSRQAPGILLHAYTISNILQQDFLLNQSPYLILLIMLFLSTVTVVPIILAPRLILAALPPLLASAGYYIFAYIAFSANAVFVITPIIFTILFSTLLAYSYRTYLENSSRLKVRKMLGQYVSPRVLTEVIDSKDDLHAEIGSKEELSILFSDIRGFTNISETLEAPQVVELLNIYFSDMTDLIFHYDGTLDKFIGDAIMAFWGAPIKSTDHALQAVHCAIDMSKQLENVNSQLVEKGYPAINIGIGIHTGNVVLGNIGSDKKLDYTIIGDGVNLASRLEGSTKTYGCVLIISEDTYRAVRDIVPCILIDRVRVKGKQLPIDLYTPAEIFPSGKDCTLSVQQLTDKVQQGFQLYLDKKWTEASENYAELGSCALSELMQTRCREFRTNDPGEVWDGVYTFTTK